MSLVNTVVAFIVALGVLIVVHEYGHYFVARLCGVKVLRFSVGFGRPLALWRRGRDRTEWVIAAVPFGGYVKMLDEREGAVAPEEAHRAFNRQSVWRRTAIVVAGPLFNLAFGIGVSVRIPSTTSNVTVAGSIGPKERALEVLPDYAKGRVAGNQNFINHSTTLTIGPAEGVALAVIGEQPGSPPVDLYVALR